MSDEKKAPGSISWMDLTVPDAEGLRDFYGAVAGWKPSGVDMGGYEDWCMISADGQAVGGICHARGGNAGLPAKWLVYITVEDLDASIARLTELGGKVLAGPKAQGDARYCVFEDPAGAVAALYQP